MRLYKYVVAERLDVLQGGHIRFSPPSALNDPYEGRPYVERFTAPEDMEREVLSKLRDTDFMDMLEEFTDNAMKEIPEVRLLRIPRWQVREMVKGMIQEKSPELEALKEAYIQQMGETMETMQPQLVSRIPTLIDEKVGLLCLTESCDNRLMWSHYAREHSGMVLEFDASHPFFNPSDDPESVAGRLRKVAYSAERPAFPVFVREDEDYCRIFFVKDDKWSYEAEWRVVRLLDEADRALGTPGGTVHLFALPPECVTRAILGCRMDADVRQQLVEFLESDPRYRHVAVAQAIMDDRSFGLKIEPY